MNTKLILPLAVVASVLAIVTWAARAPESRDLTPAEIAIETTTTVGAIDDYLDARWADQNLPAPEPADELQVLRRLSLTLHGTVPSLEEVRQFEADTGPDKLDRWTERMLADERFGTYFAERLARAIVGVETGPFIFYRRDRFVDWLSEELQQDRPWSDIARAIIAGRGLSTGTPQTNFITVALANDELDVNKLAGRTSRAFLGQRIDCAQCHDHPFDDWKQTDFEGLAAFYSQAAVNIGGIRDQDSFLFEMNREPPADGEVPQVLRGILGRNGHGLAEYATVLTIQPKRLWVLADGEKPAVDSDEQEDDPAGNEPESTFRPRYVVKAAGPNRFTVHDYQYEHAFDDMTSMETRVVNPAPPFNPEWIPSEGTRREKLAGWVTNENNERFGRAIANRVWGLMFGRAYYDPVDDLPDPGDTGTAVLDILAKDFRSHDDSIHRLIRTVTGTKAFRAASTTGELSSPSEYENMKADFAVFPMVRLRPEQVIGSMLQASYVRTINQNSHLFVRGAKFFNEIDFVREYGDPGDAELDERSGTIPQALLRMNGNLTNERTKVDAFGAPGRILALSPSDEVLIENCYLVCLTRRPTPEEKTHFLKQFAAASENDRNELTQDLYWSLFNSDEFSWNH